MTLEANVLGEDGVRVTARGYEIDVHLAWYRSLPLSCIENISISIAGKTIPRDNIFVLYDERELALDELSDMIEEWWFVQDPLTVLVPDPSPQEGGSRANIEVELATRIPYIIIGPETALVQRTKVNREVTLG